MKQGALIFVIDDEVQIRRFLNMNLTSYGYKVEEASSAEEGLLLLPSSRPDLVLLDLCLPNMSGLDFIKQLRTWTQVPVIILTVKDSEQDKISLLEGGADDYITKPFSIGELQARIKVALRHSLPEKDQKNGIYSSGSLKIDYNKHLVFVDDKEVKLTPTEYSLLVMLSKNPGKLVTQNQIMKELWGPNMTEETQYLRIYILQLRRKIEEDPTNPKKIITEPGVGYRLL